MTSIPDAAELRRQAHEQWRKDDVTRALLEERVGYVSRAEGAREADDAKAAAKWDSRVAQVDAELRRVGSEDAIPSARKPRKAAVSEPAKAAVSEPAAPPAS